MKQTEEYDAYAEGFDAAYAGYPETYNPHDPNDPLEGDRYYDWNDGWRDGLDQAST